LFKNAFATEPLFAFCISLNTLLVVFASNFSKKGTATFKSTSQSLVD
jgi:hypothetical protein